MASRMFVLKRGTPGTPATVLCMHTHCYTRHTRLLDVACDLCVEFGSSHALCADGRREAVQFDKITSRVTKLSYGLNQEHVDPVRRC